MHGYQVTAVRVCGLATLVVVVASVVEMSAMLLGIRGGPRVQMTMGLAVLVALAGFVLANVHTRAIARSVSASAAAIIVVLSAVYVYKALAMPVCARLGQSLNAIDVAMVPLLFVLLAVMFRSAWREGRAASAV